MPNCRSGLNGPVSTRAGHQAQSARGFVTAVATVGGIAAGVALLEVGLLPGMVIGGAAVLVPRYLRWRRRTAAPLPNAAVPRPVRQALPAPDRPVVKEPPIAGGRVAVKQALAKTITFRLIVTGLDFTTNYVVIGELGTAAGLSAFALVVGPVFYFVHEAAWHSVGTSTQRESGRWGPTVNLPVLLPIGTDEKGRQSGWTISRALAKTITFRTIATTMDFATTYVVVGDFATAVGLSAVGFVAGPFIYLAHEMVWDRYGWRGEPPSIGRFHQRRVDTAIRKASQRSAGGTCLRPCGVTHAHKFSLTNSQTSPERPSSETLGEYSTAPNIGPLSVCDGLTSSVRLVTTSRSAELVP
jgi:uncharacterized membrane protein